VFKAILMRLFGLSPIYEVRTVSQLTGKTLPGTLLHSGSGYRAARAAFKSAKLKDGHIVRLQAVVRLDAKKEKQKVWTNDDKDRYLETLRAKNKAKVLDEKIPTDYGYTPIYREPAEPAEPKTWDIAASNARQSEYMHQHQDEPNFDGPDEDDEVKLDHDCNRAGPMIYSHEAGAYVSTCSLCADLKAQPLF